MPGKKKEGTAGGVSGGGSFLDEKGCLVLWCLVKKIEGLGEDLWCLEKEGEEAVGSVSRVEPVLGTKRGPRVKVSRWFLTLPQPLGKKFTPG